MALTQPTASALAGTQLGRYTILGKLAMGGMAEVFLARQDGPRGFAKTVVIKRILPQFADDQEFLQMFLDEARLAALINHPHVVQIFELGEDPETQTFFMSMEYIDGRNLKQVATRALELGTQLSARVGARIIADAASGLDFAHNLKDGRGEPLNLVHRDISAENLLMSYAGMVKVVDFGIAKAAHLEGRTKTGQVKGKFGYMSPEQLLGHPVDRRTDVWALGITLYWLLTGKRPFRGENEGRIIQQVVSDDLPPLERRGTAVPNDLELIVRKSLEKNPGRRFQTAGELQGALEEWLRRSTEPVNTASLAGLMEQLFPEKTDKDRVLTRALLLGEIQQQDTPWQTRLAGQKGGSQTSEPRSRPPPRPWLAPVAGAVLGTVVVAGALIGWQAYRDADLPPPVMHRTPVVLPVVKPPVAPSDMAERIEKPLEHEPDKAPLPSTPAAPTSTDETQVPAPVPAVVQTTPEPSTRDPKHKSPSPKHKGAAASSEAEEKRGAPGVLEIETRPWASVSIDGRRIGTTPMAPVTLPAGKHRVELMNEDLGVHLIRTVEVKAGETAKLREKLVAGGE